MDEENKQKTALITGVTGQDGSYLAEFLLEKGYKVIGLKRRTSIISTSRIDHIYSNPNFILEYGNMSDASCLWNLLSKYKPDEIYNLAAQSHVKTSFDVSEETLDIVGAGVLRLLNASKAIVPNAKIYQASSSVTGDTPVLIRKNKNEIKLEKIENLVNPKFEKTEYSNLECLTIDRKTLKLKWSPIAYAFSHKSSNVYNIKGTGGFNIGITGNHSAMVINKNGELIEKKIDDIKVGDYLLSFMSFNNNFEEKERKYPIFNLEKFINSKNDQVDSLVINDDICRLIGFYLAKGNILAEEKIIFSFHIKDESFINDIKNIMKNNLGIKRYVTKLISKNFRKIEFSSKQLAKFFLEQFKTGTKQKEIPSWVYNLPKTAFINLLQGYFGNSKFSKNEIRYTYANKSITQALLYISKLNGISPTILNRKTGMFGLSFSLKDRNEIYHSTETNLKFKQGNGTLIESNVFNNLASSHIKKLNGYKKNISKEKILKVLEKLKTKTEFTENLIKLEKLSNSDIHIVKIKRIEKLKEENINVYDLHVPESQIFIGGNYPLILHNSEMFGDNPEVPQNEETKFMPASPYACAKVFAHNICLNYREAYKMFICSGILQNHESPRRGETFVTRKITLAAARIKLGIQSKLELGNLEAKRDWGYAKEYVEAMWLMLQQPKPDVFVIATGENHSVREFAETVFEYAGLNLQDHLVINPRLFRPHEVPCLKGDYSKAKRILGWEPKVKFKELAKIMYDSDLDLLKKGLIK
jgi:GDP-D-mannose dehydratase